MMSQKMRNVLKWIFDFDRTSFNLRGCHATSLKESYFFAVKMYSTYRLEKITSVVRDTSVYRHNGGPIKGPPYTSQYDSAVMVRGVSGRPSIRSP